MSEQSTAYEIAVLYEEARRRREEGNSSGAFARYRRLLELAEERGDLRGRAELLTEIGDMYQRMCETVPARHWYEQALTQFLSLGDEIEAARIRLRLGEISQVEGSLSAARGWYESALSASDPGVSGLARALLGALSLAEGQEALGVAELCGAFLLQAECPTDRERIIHLLRHAEKQMTRSRFCRLVSKTELDAEQRAAVYAAIE